MSGRVCAAQSYGRRMESVKVNSKSIVLPIHLSTHQHWVTEVAGGTSVVENTGRIASLA